MQRAMDRIAESFGLDWILHSQERREELESATAEIVDLKSDVAQLRQKLAELEQRVGPSA